MPWAVPTRPITLVRAQLGLHCVRIGGKAVGKTDFVLLAAVGSGLDLESCWEGYNIRQDTVSPCCLKVELLSPCTFI